MKQILKAGIFQAARWSGMSAILRRMLAGQAVILMFHEIQHDCRPELMTGTSVANFEYSLNWLRREGWEIVSLATCLERLTTNAEPHRYAVITFDDGYRDNVTNALPFMERNNLPFTMYVPTGAVTRTLQPWWLGLRQLFRSRDEVVIDAMGVRFRCADFDAKTAALSKVNEWVHEDYTRAALLAPTFEKAGLSLSSLNEAYFLDERELQVLAQHPLASIGGHTSSHAPLATLDINSARAEITENRDYLEDLIQLPVPHFAYPYGRTKACGLREEGLAREAGFLTAVTARHGQVSDCNLNRFALPRIGVGGQFDTRAAFEGRMNGVQLAVHRLVGLA